MAGDDKDTNVRVRLLVKAVPVRNYLEDNVVPLLMQGMQSLIVERPPNPVGYLGEFLVRNDPLKPPEPEKKTECEHCAHSPLPPPLPAGGPEVASTNEATEAAPVTEESAPPA